MTFELLTKTKTKLQDVVVLSQKNRQPDDNPGAKLSVEMSLSNDMLAFFDGSLKSFLFTKNGAVASAKGSQAPLDGIPPVSDTPNLTPIGAKVGALHWEQEMTGYELVIDLGLGGKRSNIEIADCTLSDWRLIPKEGGSFLARFNIESEDVSEAYFGKLAKLKSREIEITLRPPEVGQVDIEDKPAPVARKPARDAHAAGDAFAEAHGRKRPAIQ